MMVQIYQRARTENNKAWLASQPTDLHLVPRSHSPDAASTVPTQAEEHIGSY